MGSTLDGTLDSSTQTLAQAAHDFAGLPKQYSPTPIWWWSGERLEPQRLRRQLEQFAAGGVYNLVILNLAPSGPLYGSDADDPPFFSPAWWEIFLGVCADAQELGVRLWFYDQIGFSGANLQGGLVRDDPALAGQWLASAVVEGEGVLSLHFPSEAIPLAVSVTPLADGRPVSGATVTRQAAGRLVTDSGAGPRRLRLIYAVRRGFDYCSPSACARLLDTVHGEFERRAGHFFGSVIAGSFQDELPSLPTWSAGFLAAFTAQCGYDLLPKLGLLWEGEEGAAQAVRADFHAVRAALAEEAFFKPLFHWHERHGLICGFDQQGPARAGDPLETVTLYADYLKTHRWFGAPGSDHHGEAKIHSSLAHLYDRPRVWIEAFHSSGWGGTLEETFDWLLPWLRAGATLYDPHAVYYSTHGGWWEWAPPSTCWRQPYWRHYPLFAAAVSRICYLLSQGEHVCDIGVLFPTTTVQAHTTPDGALPPAQAAHALYKALVGRMVWFDAQPGVLDNDRRDYDVLDDDSLQRGTVADGTLAIGAERYRALVLPGCVTLAAATAAQLCRFVESGGLLVAIGARPQYITGAQPVGGEQPDAGAEPVQRLRQLLDAGRGAWIEDPADLPAALAGLPRRIEAPVPVLQRRIDGHDVLFVPATAARASEVGYKEAWWDIQYNFDPARYQRRMTVRVTGAQGTPQLWNPLDGSRRRLAARTLGDVTEIEIPFDDSPAALVVWGDAEELPPVTGQEGGAAVALLDTWEGQVEPTLDNRFGDLDRPAYAGAPPVQTWRFDHYRQPGGDGQTARPPAENEWQPVEATFGVYGFSLGPLPPAQLPPPAQRVEELQASSAAGSGWRPARYSLTRGITHDRVHNWTLGPKGHVPYEFLDFGPVHPGQALRFRTSITLSAAANLHFALAAGAAKRLWVNGRSLGDGPAGYLWLQPVYLQAGINLVEWELAAEQAVNLRAAWALVRNPARFARPEWLTTVDAPQADTLVRFSGRFTIPFVPIEGVLHTGTAFGCRVLVNGVTAGQQGGFDPYGFQMRVYRHTSTAFQKGDNLVTLEVHDPGRLVEAWADVRVRGAQGEEAVLMSGPHWQVQRGDAPPTPAPLRRFQATGWNSNVVAVTLDPPAVDLWRRPHPLPGADWLEDQPHDGSVLALAPDAYGGQPRVEWLRWTLPPGATAMHLPLNGSAQLWVDDVEIPIRDGEAAIPPSKALQRMARLRVEPAGGHSEGALLSGPVTYTLAGGPMGLGDWAQYGLASYSGGLRYRTSFTLPADLAADRSGRLLVLDLGGVRGTAEVWVNGQPLGARIWSPYRFVLTPAVQAGENQVEVLVCNTLAPYLHATSPTHYVFDGQEVSGLLGPVRVLQLP